MNRNGNECLSFDHYILSNHNIAQAQYRKIHIMRESGRDNESRAEIVIIFA